MAWTEAGPTGKEPQDQQRLDRRVTGGPFVPKVYFTPAVSRDMQQGPGKLPESPLRRPRIVPVPGSREWTCGQVVCFSLELLSIQRDRSLIGASFYENLGRIGEDKQALDSPALTW